MNTCKRGIISTVLLLYMLAACAPAEGPGDSAPAASTSEAAESSSETPVDIHSLAAGNAAGTMDLVEIAAGEDFLGWQVEQAFLQIIPGGDMPRSLTAEFTGSAELTGRLIVNDGGMNAAATFLPDAESLERLPAIPALDRHIADQEWFETGIYGEDVDLFAALEPGVWDGVVIRVDRVLLALHIPSYSKHLHTVEIVDRGTKAPDEADN